MIRTHLSFVAIALEMYRAEGILSFYKGLTPTVIRSFPVNAVIFLVYEKLIELSHYLE